MSNLTVPLGEAETSWSFASRLAARNGVNAREFCLDWETRFQAVVNGDPSALGVIAGFAGISSSALATHCFYRIGRWGFDYRGQRLDRLMFRYGKIHVCPACLKNDIRRNPKLAPRIAVFHRALWMIDAFRTCPAHNIALVCIADPTDIRTFYDFALCIGPEIASLDRLEAAASRRRPSRLENYIIRRLDGAQQSPFLDSLELYAGIRTCSMIGAADLFGRAVSMKELTDDEWHKAGDRGFQIAAGGPAAIAAFLDRLHASFDFGHNGLEGIRAFYGRLYEWLASNYEDAAYGPVREIIGQHIRAHLPLAAGQPVFRKPLEKRVLHSIRSLSFEAGLHPKRLRRVLLAAGIIDQRQGGLPDQHVVFAAEAASSLVEAAKSAMSLPEAGEYLNAPRAQVALLAKNKFIEPHVKADTAGALDRFATADLDVFLQRLLDGSTKVHKPKPHQCSIPVAAKAACCSAVEIIRLALDKKLKWTGTLFGTEGYLSLLVDVGEIKRHVCGPTHGGISLRKVASMLETNDRVVRALIDGGHLKAIVAINPVNRCPQTVVSPAEVARFRKTYISLFQLARARGKHIATVKNEMRAACVKPALAPIRVKATFYLRKSC
jgi:lambda repressor-like predicted transcriptional regulator